jgi:hypothetical protein
MLAIAMARSRGLYLLFLQCQLELWELKFLGSVET